VIDASDRALQVASDRAMDNAAGKGNGRCCRTFVDCYAGDQSTLQLASKCFRTVVDCCLLVSIQLFPHFLVSFSHAADIFKSRCSQELMDTMNPMETMKSTESMKPMDSVHPMVTM
jgi:hypothetical protein